MTPTEEKAKAIINKITSHAHWHEWNGVPRSMIEKCISNGLDEYSKQKCIDLLSWLMKVHPPGYLSESEIYDRFIKSQ